MRQELAAGDTNKSMAKHGEINLVVNLGPKHGERRRRVVKAFPVSYNMSVSGAVECPTLSCSHSPK